MALLMHSQGSSLHGLVCGTVFWGWRRNYNRRCSHNGLRAVAPSGSRSSKSNLTFYVQGHDDPPTRKKIEFELAVKWKEPVYFPLARGSHNFAVRSQPLFPEVRTSISRIWQERPTYSSLSRGLKFEHLPQEASVRGSLQSSHINSAMAESYDWQVACKRRIARARTVEAHVR